MESALQRNVGVGSLTLSAPARIPRRETAMDLSVTRLHRALRGPTLSVGAGLGLTSGFNFGDGGAVANLRLQAGIRGW
ncbi:MAG: hypothetical protein U5K74_01485 [Gemmatimonadaceae bacterium]|nr:hypothetical protein [Gemmatimonadaceae bacterium]